VSNLQDYCNGWCCVFLNICCHFLL
jgi:hypothetical protein